MTLIHLSEEQVYHIVDRATVLTETLPDSENGMKWGDPAAFNRAMSYVSSPEARALTDAVRSLSKDARDELKALMWLGRGDFGGDFGALVEEARNNSGTRDVEYITENAPSLPVYLTRGLAALSPLS